MGKRQPTEDQWADARYGLELARAIGRLDLGQTVVVKDRVAVAVEALEGTDACIRRGGELAKEGAVVVKAVKPQQDRRFDLPAVGPGHRRLDEGGRLPGPRRRGRAHAGDGPRRDGPPRRQGEDRARRAALMPWLREVPGGVVLEILVQPRASRTRVVGEHDGRLKVQLAAPPVDGEANAALVDFLADALGARQSDVTIERGDTGRRKTRPGGRGDRGGGARRPFR